MRELDEEAKKAGIVVMNEIGLDPGIDHLYAVKTTEEVQVKGGKIKHFFSYCGGLPAQECSNNSLGDKFPWSSRGVVLALLNSASYIFSGKKVAIRYHLKNYTIFQKRRRASGVPCATKASQSLSKPL